MIEEEEWLALLQCIKINDRKKRLGYFWKWVDRNRGEEE